MKKVFLFNGPPSSGKDTAAKHLYSKMHVDTEAVIFERFSAPLKTAFAAITGKTYNHYYEVAYYEEHKEEVIPWLGVSFRQWQIDFSEKFMKPNYGDDIFGQLFLQRVCIYTADSNNKAKAIVVPDSGFSVEIDVLEKYYPIEDIILCRVHREGYDFKKDSRSYIYSDKIFSIDLLNNGTQQDFEAKVASVYRCFTGENNWLLTNGGKY